MGASLGVSLASFSVMYHTPSLFGAVLVLVSTAGAVHVRLPWWSVLLQAVAGSAAGLGLHVLFPTVNPNEPRFNILAMPVTKSRFMLHWVSALAATICYGFLYYLDMPTARLVDPRHVFMPWVGPLTSTATYLAVDGAMHMARRAFVNAKRHTPPTRAQAAAVVCVAVTVIDLMVHGEHWSTYLLPVAVLLFILQLWVSER